MKETAHAAEQERADVKASRQDWFAEQLDLDPDALVFLDETAAYTNMARCYGWAPRGVRCRAVVPCGHHESTTVTTVLRTTGLITTALLDGLWNGALRAYVTDTLVTALQTGRHRRPRQPHCP